MNITESFEGRYSLSQAIANILGELFDDDVDIIPFGVEKIANKNEDLLKYLDSIDSNFSHSAMLVKFAPDFILLKKSAPQKLYFLEIKTSLTPLWSLKRHKEICDMNKKYIKLSDIGDIAREAWNAYNNLFPNTIILDACTYNPNLLVAEFVENIKCLRCHYDINQAYDCNKCPMKRNDFFEINRNINSSGSKTPHTNIDLSTLRNVKDFFSEIGIKTNDKTIDIIKNKLIKNGIFFPQNVDYSVRMQVTNELIKEGCYWLK